MDVYPHGRALKSWKAHFQLNTNKEIMRIEPRASHTHARQVLFHLATLQPENRLRVGDILCI